MKKGGLGIYTNGDWNWGIPYVYINNSWQKINPYVYSNNEWTLCGAAGTLMIKFITSDNKDFYDSNNKIFLVRQN